MKGFTGFPAGKQPSTPVPNLFFTELLPDLDHLGELKVTLHLFWLLAQKADDHACVSQRELLSDTRLLSGLASAGLSGVEALREALDRAVARGTLLRVRGGEGGEQREWYFANSAKGRRAVQELLAGRWQPAELEQPMTLQAQQPNIFVLYEQNIGTLTPLLAEQLMEAERTYPASWIEDAFREAVELNKRSWRYIERILQRWADEGKTDEAPRRSDEEDWRRFL